MEPRYVENPAFLSVQEEIKPRAKEEPEVITLGRRKFILDRSLLRFDETNVNQFLSDFASIYDEFGEGHALAQAEQDSIKHRYESLKQQRFAEFKEGEKCTEKLAEAKAINDADVQELHEKLIQATYRSKRLAIWLRSLDDSHDSVREFCYNLRKEMDKIGLARIKEIQY